MLALILAALLQTGPEAATPPKDNGLPKTDYELVAWCHGALAGQLELDPIAKADMEKIEGKAKVAARAKQDAEMEQERRGYLKDYERALAAAEAASPANIHQKGVQAELQGYRLWTGTRGKEPIWRMLDWGMWDPNDVGCGEAATRLHNKATLFGEALKGSADAKPEPVAAPLAAEEKRVEEKPADAKPIAETSRLETQPVAVAETSATEVRTEATPVQPRTAKKPAKLAVKKPASKAAKAEPAAQAPAEAKAGPAVAPAEPSTAPVASETAPSDAAAAPAPVRKPVKVAAKKPAAAKKTLSMDSSVKDIRAAIAAGKAETIEKPAGPIAPSVSNQPADPGLRGPQ